MEFGLSMNKQENESASASILAVNYIHTAVGHKKNEKTKDFKAAFVFEYAISYNVYCQ